MSGEALQRRYGHRAAWRHPWAHHVGERTRQPPPAEQAGVVGNLLHHNLVGRPHVGRQRLGARLDGILRQATWAPALDYVDHRHAAGLAVDDQEGVDGVACHVAEDFGAGRGNRTLVISLEGCCSTIELHPRNAMLRHYQRRRSDTRSEVSRSIETNIGGGGGRTRTYEGLASGFTVRPLCHSGHSSVPSVCTAKRRRRRPRL